MWALDGLREAHGASDELGTFALILAGCVILGTSLALLAALQDMLTAPRVWPVVVGSVAFWPLAFTGWPVLAVAAVVLSLALSSLSGVGCQGSPE